MGDGLNSVQSEVEDIQPVDAVPAEAEEQIPAQDQDTEQSEVYVEGEGDQEQPKGMSQSQLRAAWKKEKTKRQAYADEVKQLKDEVSQLKGRIDPLETSVTSVARGPKPDPFEYSSKEEFYEALETWEKSGKPEARTQEPAQKQAQQGVQLTEDQDFSLYQAETSLKEKVPGYDEAKDRAIGHLQRAFGVGSEYDIGAALVQSTYMFGLDPAKIFFALDKLPQEAQKLAFASKDPRVLRETLQELEGKVKLRERVKADTKPEPTINSSGPIDPFSEQLKKAREDYANNPTIENHKKLQAVRKRSKAHKG